MADLRAAGGGAQIVPPDEGKASHADVGYRTGFGREVCSMCRNFIQGKRGRQAHCKGVVDPIAPGAWCVRFVPSGR